MSPENTEALGDSEEGAPSAGEMGLRRGLAKRTDNGLSRDERETGLDFFSADDRFTIYSYAPPIVRDVLRHGEASIEWLYVEPNNGRGRREENLAEVADMDAVDITGVKATLPTAVLKIKGRPRKRGVPSSIVSTPSDVEGVGEEFK